MGLMAIFGDFLTALAQLSDRRFRRVVWIGALLALALLVAIYAAFLWFLQTFTPETVEIPLVGPVGGLDTLLSFGSALFMLGLSVFLMVPVASAFTGLFLEDVTDAVDARYYSQLPIAPRTRFMDGLVASANFLGLMIAVNVVAVFIYLALPIATPIIFWLVNGFLLGREYFTLVALRRLGRDGARALRKQHRGTIWIAGALMAAPLSIPILNLFIPVLGVATFTHLFHRINGTRITRT